MMATGDQDRNSGAAKHELFGAEAVRIEASDLSSAAVLEIIESERRGTRFGRISGGFFILLGAVLVILGVTGGTNLTMSVIGLSINLNDAAPGIVFAAIGLTLYWMYRPDVRIVTKSK